MKLSPDDVETLVDIADRLRAMGARVVALGDFRVEFGPGAAPAPVDRDPHSPTPEASKAPPRSLREAAERQGLGPLPFPGAAS